MLGKHALRFRVLVRDADFRRLLNPLPILGNHLLSNQRAGGIRNRVGLLGPTLRNLHSRSAPDTEFDRHREDGARHDQKSGSNGHGNTLARAFGRQFDLLIGIVLDTEPEAYVPDSDLVSGNQ